MPTGTRSQRKRPRNDLDVYLQEINSYLFCVSKADKRCLLNDIKAHVRELTTDEASSSRFRGRYGIDRDQLIAEVGSPDSIASDYIQSVKNRHPSRSLRLVMAFTLVLALYSMYQGFAMVGNGHATAESTGSSMMTVGSLIIIGSVLVVISIALIELRFERYFRLLPYITLAVLALAIPASQAMGATFSSNLILRAREQASMSYMVVFLVYFIMLSFIGLYISMQHYRIMTGRNVVARSLE